ncbi:hypothetical protein ACTFIW_008327 [Dictyostelium discoideum]
MEINNNNNIYKLYKLVFNNLYISTIIFNYVKIFNQQITDSNRSLRSFTQRADYDQSTLEWILKNDHYQLLIDKCKSGYKFKLFTYSTLKRVFEFFSEKTNDEFDGELGESFKNFYKVNEVEIKKNSDLSDNETLFKKISLLELSVYSQSFYLLKMFTNEELINKPHLKINTLKNEFITEKPFSSGFIAPSLLDLALKLGNINIIKFLHTQLEIKIREPQKALHYALLSNNRSIVVQYLLDDLNYTPPQTYNGAYDNYFFNLMQLDFNILKRVYYLGSPLLSHGNDIPKLTSIFNETFKKSTEIPFKRYLEFIQSSIFIGTVIKSPNYVERNSLLLKKIKHLIKYNNDIVNKKKKTNNQLYLSLKEKDLIKPNIIKNLNNNDTKNNDNINININNNNNNNNNKNNNDDNSLFKKFKLIFGSYQQSIEKKQEVEEKVEIIKKNQISDDLDCRQIDKTNADELDEIKYENFDLQREVERVYIFGYLAKESLGIMNENFKILAVNFARKYEEYNLIYRCNSDSSRVNGDEQHFKTTLLICDFFCDYKLLNYLNSNLKPKPKHVFIPLVDTIQSDEDNLTYEYLSKSFYKKNDNISNIVFKFCNEFYEPKSFLFDLNEFKNVDQQIQFLKTKSKSELKGIIIMEVLLKHIFKPDNKQFNFPDHANQIASIIEDYYNNNNNNNSNSNNNTKPTEFEQFSSVILTSNPKLFIYYYENHKDLFKWDSPDIGRSIVSKGDLELIKYIFKNNIGNLNFIVVSDIDFGFEFDDAEYNYNHNNNNNKNNKNKSNQPLSTILDCSKTKQVTQLLLELGFKFSINSLYHYYFLDDWNSNYLFNFAFNQLAMLDQEIELCYNFKDYIHNKLIESKIIGISSDNNNNNNNNGRILNHSKIKLPPNSRGMYTLASFNDPKLSHEEEVSKYFKNLFNFNFVFETGNYNNVLSFFNDYSNSNKSHKKNYSFEYYDLSQINNIHPSFPIVELIEKKIKEGIIIINN